MLPAVIYPDNQAADNAINDPVLFRTSLGRVTVLPVDQVATFEKLTPTLLFLYVWYRT